MHQIADVAQPMTSQLLFGFDLERLFLRLDFRRRAGDFLRTAEIQVAFLAPVGLRVRIAANGDGVAAHVEQRSDGGWQPAERTLDAAAQEILELAIPFSSLGLPAGSRLELFVSVHHQGTELERYPAHRPLEISVPSADFEAHNWTA
jgi:hypothetical protein